jgi:PAS domain S-box-containing protein
MEMMAKARIMVVEDDRIVARDIREQLGRIGHTVVAVTHSGEAAVDLAVAERPDLVLMDIRLDGGMDGIDAAQLIRAQCQIPVVFLTAYADDETVRRASSAEPFGYLLKPFEDLHLRSVIAMALHKHAAERKLRESERRFEATLSSIGDGVIATDERSRITFINPVAERLTGWPRQQAIGQTLAAIYRVSDRDDGAGAAAGTPSQATLTSRDGRAFPIDETRAPIIDDAGASTGAVLVFSDTSERRRTAAALQNAQADLARMSRMTTVGQLTASIAHEVNQPLMAVVMNADACLKWLGDPGNLDEARAAAARIVAEGHRAGEIVNRIRALARNEPIHFDVLDVNDMIESLLPLVRADFNYQGLNFTADLQPGRLSVVGDRVQLQQVVLNLLSNAAEAINACQNAERDLSVTTRQLDGGEVCIAIEDSGDGLDATVIERIFDPFFTTKKGGIGMGLSICRSIIDAHGGRLWAEPRSPRGARFRFVLPSSAV